jgi:hypothetical protein
MSFLWCLAVTILETTRSAKTHRRLIVAARRAFSSAGDGPFRSSARTASWRRRRVRQSRSTRLRASSPGAHTRAGPSSGRCTGGGVEGNERLTALTGLILIALLAVLGVTILRIHQLIWLHLFVGLGLLGPVALKMSSMRLSAAADNGIYLQSGVI